MNMRTLTRKGQTYNMENNTRFSGLTGNQLKIIALITMTVDHMGLVLFPGADWMRIVGRLAFPIFAYMVGEGCTYTRSPEKYLGKMGALALTCQIVYYLVDKSLYQCVLVTFFLSAGLIFLIKWTKQRAARGKWLLPAAYAAGMYFVTELLPLLLDKSDFGVDYGFCGAFLPVLVYLGGNRKQKLGLFTLGLAALSLSWGGIQWFCLLSLPLLMLYNGRRGIWKMKNLFYIYYPAHLAVIYAAGLLV